jgi:hypothetical protein
VRRFSGDLAITIVHNKTTAKGLLALNSAQSKWFYRAGICAVVAVLSINLFITARQEAWEDEIFAVSTGWSLARSQTETLSVLADYPRTGSPIPFYGPVSFYAEAWLIRAFGLSPFAWRFVCFLGIVLCVSVCAALAGAVGGDKWAQLFTALFISLSASVSGTFPGRWDFVTSGLFLSSLLLIISSTRRTGGTLLWRAALSGIPIGIALASSPRALTLTLASLVAVILTAVGFKGIRRVLVLASAVAFSAALAIHSFLLLPWGLNSASWYAYLRRATKNDYINATPLVGRGLWVLDLKHHKVLALAFPLLLIAALVGVFQRNRSFDRTKLPLKIFLTVFAVTNSLVMLLMLANALGQTAFWVPPAIVATMCWVDLQHLRSRGWARFSMILIGFSLLLLSVEEFEQAAAVTLTWNQRSTTALNAFVRQNTPAGSSVYGPVGGYFYPVEFSRSRYLYLFEHTTPGLDSEPGANIGDKLDKTICSHHSYAIWPKSDPVRHPESPIMPNALRERLGPRVAELDEPPIATWKVLLLDNMSQVGGKYGFSDAVIYSLNSKPCGKD